MAKRNWGNGLAVGLIIGFGVGVLIILVLEVSSPIIDPSASGAPNQNTTENKSTYNYESVPDWWYWPRRFFALEDTVAQWIMMVFTVAAAALLLFTLKATQQMAFDTREIGDMQNRPWLKCDLEFSGGLLAARDSLPFGMRLNVTNIGKSPAVNVLVDVFLFQSLGHYDEVKIEGLRNTLIRRAETEHERPGAILPEETFHKMRAESLIIDRFEVLPFRGGVVPVFCVVAIYKIATDKEWHCTATIFDVFVKDADGVGLGHPLPLDGRAIPREGLNVVMRRTAIAT